MIRKFVLLLVCAFLSMAPKAIQARQIESLDSVFREDQGIVAIIAGNDCSVDGLMRLLHERSWTVFYQSSDKQNILLVRQAAEKAGMLGRRLFVHEVTPDSIPLSHNLADAAWVTDQAAKSVNRDELLRVLRPLAKARIGENVVTKPKPEGMDDWSHPYHGPDNNTQSNDKLVRGEFQTQFMGYPMFSPMPEQSVIAGGRIYKAMGNIAHKANQNEMLNTLLCINAYNGTILWRRPVPEGFMIHRNTMVGTDDALYMGDHESCKVFDAITGDVKRSIKVDPKLTDGPCWKWMALQGDTLYALVGNPEVEIRTIRSDRPGIGHWPWGMWDGHDYNDPRTAFGHGRTLVALDRNTGELKWHFRDHDFLDARAVVMKGDKIYAYSPEKFLLCIDATNGKEVWRNKDENLLAAIGPNEKAQHYVTGYATTSYMKCNDEHLFFAGPQRKQTVVASTSDGRLEWTNPVGNLQLVLRPEAIYAAGPENTRGMLLEYKNGSEIASLPARRACTRATGCADSIFFRASGGTVRVMAATATEGVAPRHIAPMRPPCQDGVLVSNGHLYWGPWMCGCQLSLYGNIGLRPIADGELPKERDLATAEKSSLRQAVDQASLHKVQPLGMLPGDWKTFQASNDRKSKSSVTLSNEMRPGWSAKLIDSQLSTAPVAAGGLVFVADRSGAVRAFKEDGSPAWTSYTSGSIFFPPAVDHDRVYVGSADGRVYAFEAATGRQLWSYCVAPEDRRISVFDNLVSRWPVAGGVVVHEDCVYAAAGFTHYDGTYVVALDAVTGRPRAINDNSGKLSDQVHSGVSMQGELSIVDGELRFAGGGIYELARYRLDDLQCLNEPRHQLNSQYRTAFYAWYPNYNKFVSLEHALSDGRVLSFDSNYDGSYFENLQLEPARQLGLHGKAQKDLAGEFLRRRGKEVPTHLWRDDQQRRFTSFAVCENCVVGTGHKESDPAKPFIVALNPETGVVVWEHELPADAVKGGIAVSAKGQIFVTLENGQLLNFAAKK
jgi:outer membrane protein assembly factor BamB